METTTAPATCETPEDFRECETCERTFPEEETRTCNESGVTTCDECEAAEMAYWSRQCVGINPYPTDAQLREDMAGFLPGDDEWIKLATLLNR